MPFSNFSWSASCSLFWEEKIFQLCCLLSLVVSKLDYWPGRLFRSYSWYTVLTGIAYKLCLFGSVHTGSSIASRPIPSSQLQKPSLGLPALKDRQMSGHLAWCQNFGTFSPISLYGHLPPASEDVILLDIPLLMDLGPHCWLC